MRPSISLSIDRSTRTKHDIVPFLAGDHKRRRLRAYLHSNDTLHIPHRVSIKERPVEAQNQIQLGHWEADTLISRRTRAALAVILERINRHLHLAKLPAKTSRSFRGVLTRKLSPYPKPFRHSITYDNGCENVEHECTNKVMGSNTTSLNPSTAGKRFPSRRPSG